MLAAVFLSAIWLAPVVLGSPEYHYHVAHRNQEVQTANSSLPVMFNGNAIGTAELNLTAAPGTVHPLADGHHFYHADWVLTDRDGGSWEYLPGRHDKAARLLRTRNMAHTRRQSYNLQMAIQGNLGSGGGIPFSLTLDLKPAVDTFATVQTLASDAGIANAVPSASSMSWKWVDPSNTQDLLWEVGQEVIAASTSLIGDLANIFFNAVDIFA
jgi:hypothetical protein